MHHKLETPVSRFKNALLFLLVCTIWFWVILKAVEAI